MKTAEYVVVGGGVMGMSTAYNLAKKGAKNVVLLEQKYIGYGSSGRNGAPASASSTAVRSVWSWAGRL